MIAEEYDGHRALKRTSRVQRWAGIFGADPDTKPARRTQELPVVFAQLHGLVAAHSRIWTRLLPAEEAVLSDILSEARALFKPYALNPVFGQLPPAEEAMAPCCPTSCPRRAHCVHLKILTQPAWRQTMLTNSGCCTPPHMLWGR